MPAQIPAGSYLTQQLYDTAVTLFTEQKCLAPLLYRPTSKDGKDDGIICCEDRQDLKDMGDRGSTATYYFGDRRRGQDIAPKALGATQFGQAAPQRPTYKQTMVLQGQELATASFFGMEVGQAYTSVPLETKELHAAGAEAAELLCRSDYYHLAGLTAYNAGGTAGWTVSPNGNLVTELDSAHRFWMGGETTDAGVAGNTSAILTLEALETIITKLQDRSTGVISPLVPAMTPWGEWFVFITCPQGNEQMTRHSTTNRYMSLTLSEIQGGNAPDKVASFMRANSGFEGTRRLLILVDDYTPFGQSGSTSGATTSGTQIGNCRRGMLLGRLAMKKIWGQGFDAESSHIRATSHTVHLQQDWKFFTHVGGKAIMPEDHPTPQRMGSATVTYYVTGTTPTV